MRKGISITPSITDRSDESIIRFFKEIRKIPLLKPEEEVKLSEKIKNGDEKALNKLVESNLRFVVSVAKRYQGKGLPLVDLIQAGSMGLIEAAKAFDASKGFKFISFAVWHIRQHIFKALNEQSRTIRPSFKQLVSINKINKAAEKFEQENKRSPAPEEIGDYTTIPSCSPLEDEDGGFIEVLESSYSNPEEGVRAEEYHKEILDILSTLSPREHDIICLSFGIGIEAITNDHIAEMFNLTTIRVRQIIKDALNKLKERHSKELKLLL